jgi:hypothetical protein
MWGSEARFALTSRLWERAAAVSARVLLGIVSTVVVALYVVFLTNTAEKKFSSGAVIAGIAAIVALGWVIPNFMLWWQFWKIEWLPDVIEWRRSHRLCGACRYPLTNAPDPDGCTVCPECGAAWKLAATNDVTSGAQTS